MPNTTPPQPQPQPQIPASSMRRKPVATHTNAAPRVAQGAHGKTALGAAQAASTNPKPAAPTRLHPPVQKTGRTMDVAATGAQSQRVAALNARIAQKKAAANPAYARAMAARAKAIAQRDAQKAKPQVASQNTPKTAPRSAQRAVSQTAPRNVQKTMPQAASHAIRKTMPQAAPRDSQKVAPQVARQKTQEAPITAQQPEVELGIIEEYYAATITTEPTQPTPPEPESDLKPAAEPKTAPKKADQPKETPKNQSPETTTQGPKRSNWPFLSSIQVDKRPLSGARPATKTTVSAPAAPQPAVSSVVLNSISTGKKSKAPVIILFIITILLGIAAGAAVYFCIFGV